MVAAADEPSGHRRLPSPEVKRTAVNSNRRSLHNFSFPPTLSWGSQRLLRCVNLAVGDLTFFDPKPKPKRVEEVVVAMAESSPAKPWNLRTRPANPNRVSSQNPNPDPNRSSWSSPSPPRTLQVEKGNFVNSRRSEGEKDEKRREFAVSLRKEEIEEDFVKIRGSKPPRRPKKRAKYIQRQLDLLFPGFWLTEITPDLYKTEVERT